MLTSSLRFVIVTMAFGAVSQQYSLRCQAPFTTAIRNNVLSGHRCTRMRRLKLSAALPEVIEECRHVSIYGRAKTEDMPSWKDVCFLASESRILFPFLVEINYGAFSQLPLNSLRCVPRPFEAFDRAEYARIRSTKAYLSWP